MEFVMLMKQVYKHIEYSSSYFLFGPTTIQISDGETQFPYRTSEPTRRFFT
jgi:hypothetical protein